MRKALMCIIVFVLTLFGRIGYAEDLSKYLKDKPVNVIESRESIDIYIRFSMEGKADKFAVPGTQITYEKAFVKGVKDMWEGSYKGKPVYVHMEQLDARDKRCKVKVRFSLVRNSEDYPCARVVGNDRNIWIYSGDGRSISSLVYDYSSYTYAAGHEMGHCLMLKDVYLDKNLQGKLYTPMNCRNAPHAQEVDYYILLKHRTWERDTGFYYGDDDRIDKFIKVK